MYSSVVGIEWAVVGVLFEIVHKSLLIVENKVVCMVEAVMVAYLSL